MIRYAKNEEKPILKAFWQDAFAFDDGGYTDYYFKDAYELGKHYVYEVDGEIISMLHTHRSSYMFNHRILATSMILGVATRPNRQRQGYMGALMKEVLSQLEHQELLTLIQAYHPEIYKPFGFEIVYHRNTYYFNRDNYKNQCNELIAKDYVVEDLLSAYGRFVKHFTGYKMRTRDDFELYLKEISATEMFIQAFYDHNHQQIRGYIVFSIEEETIKIDECVYLDLKTLDAMIGFASELGEQVELTVSEYENLKLMYPNVSYEASDYTMVRINDYDLWNQLFSSNVKTAKEALTLTNEPLFMHESL